MSEREEEKRARRFVTMDGLRGVAAIGVMLCHLTTDHSGSLLPSGPFAVDVFFCLSGFVIAHGYVDRLDSGLGIAAFARARLIRLYPMYLLGLLIGIVGYLVTVSAGDADNPAAVVALAAINGLFLIPTFQPLAIGLAAGQLSRMLFPFNGLAWSLFNELLCNTLFAVFRPRGWRLAATIGVALAALVVAVLMAQGSAGWGQLNWWEGPPRAFFGFYSGVALHDLWRAGRLNFGLRKCWLPLVAVGTAMFTPDGVFPFLVLALVVSPLCVALCVEEPDSQWTQRLFKRLGALSYPLYAVHLPVLELLRLSYNELIGAPASSTAPMPVNVLFAAVATAFSAILAERVDAPARRWLANRWRASSEAVGEVCGYATGTGL